MSIIANRPVDPATIAVWRWQGLTFTCVLLIPLTIASLAVGRYLWPLAPVLFALLALALVWFWPPAAYRRLRYGVDETGIAIERGVFFQSQIALPRVRIQHTDVFQGPLQRRYGVGTLKLYTAGSSHTKIELPGLAHEEALALRDQLLNEIQEEAGV